MAIRLVSVIKLKIYEKAPRSAIMVIEDLGGQRVEGLKILDSRAVQSRDNHMMASSVGMPDERAAEAIDARPEPGSKYHVDMDNEMLRSYPEKEKGRVPVLHEFGAVVLAEPFDLALREAERMEVLA